MKQIFLFFAIFSAVLSVGEGQRFRRTCPNVNTKADFNITAYEGDWYEQKRFPAIFELGLTCVKANYLLLQNGDIRVTNSGINRLFRTPSVSVGRATVPDPAEPGRLSVSFGGNGSGPYLILATDYKDYALVYSCQSYFNLFAVEFAWILRRDNSQQLQSDLRSRLYSILLKYDIQPSRFLDVYNPTC
ncbi:apolipoprotein D-like [Ylistrum balloti]|uniref:apolipoprotein D-like n=1 Tax=Ylistrum balloti TaxID=509963 RepID=UPI002905C3B3|nr:apolipoprotein D-like [Ylistrum balloti]